MESNCAVCLDRLKYPLGRPDNCEHKFCFKCISDWLKKRSQCPLCGGASKYLIKIEETKSETKVPVKKRTAKQFENELVVREQLEEDHGESLNEDITIEYASCRSCRRSNNEHLLLLCDGNVGQNADGSTIRCNVAYHSYCLPEKLEQIPKDDWFCPFCANKPENAQNFVKQTNLNVPRSEEVGTSDSTQLKNKVDVCQVSKSHPSGSWEQNNVKIETTECSNITNSESTIIQGAYGDSDAESVSIESDCSDENSELYSASDATVGDYDDSNEITVDDSVITVENTSGKNSNYKVILRNILRLHAIRTNSDVLDGYDDDDDGDDGEDDDDDDGDDNDDDKLDCDESDETDSEQKFHQSMFRDNHRRRTRMKRNCGKAIYTADKVAGFMTKTKSNSGKAVIKYQGLILTHRHSS
ncbi:hypothetical protein WUBG_04328 [Wuchereria bancrofti]|uniref:RING-type domain-containing protein n=1 Tax=Wuchereria bancrofti TaxID=6293 RepID=J9EQH0_WUCBA|nr:hypothetical protein WUBG_04328 [Wuchereria bancrofti]VDM12309.1 unnamed protein product [Wuchereria bancrofti]